MRLAPATAPAMRRGTRNCGQPHGYWSTCRAHGLALYDVKTRVSHRWAHEAPPDDSKFRELFEALAQSKRHA